MNLPKDPVMLLSVVNTQLRDHYPTLTELAAAYMTDLETASKSPMLHWCQLPMLCRLLSIFMSIINTASAMR